VPVCAFYEPIKNKYNGIKRAVGKPKGLVFFFIQRSCEYLKVPLSGKRRIGIFRLCNIRLFKTGSWLGHNDLQIEHTDCTNTFE
jgi:hypothetical protein